MQGWRGLAHPGQRQEHHHDLLCRPCDARSRDGEPHHRGHHRPQRPRWTVVWRVQPGPRPVARAAHPSANPPRPARQAGQPPLGRHRLRHHPEVHAGGG